MKFLEDKEGIGFPNADIGSVKSTYILIFY